MSDVQNSLEVRTGPRNTAIANDIVKLVRHYTGRGPTKARASVSGDLVSVLMADILTKAENKLVEDGKSDVVLQLRHEFQKTMGKDMIDAVERHTARKVVAFMSANHIDPDLAIESFVLEPERAA